MADFLSRIRSHFVATREGDRAGSRWSYFSKLPSVGSTPGSTEESSASVSKDVSKPETTENVIVVQVEDDASQSPDRSDRWGGGVWRRCNSVWVKVFIVVLIVVVLPIVLTVALNPNDGEPPSKATLVSDTNASLVHQTPVASRTSDSTELTSVLPDSSTVASVESSRLPTGSPVRSSTVNQSSIVHAKAEMDQTEMSKNIKNLLNREKQHERGTEGQNGKHPTIPQELKTIEMRKLKQLLDDSNENERLLIVGVEKVIASTPNILEIIKKQLWNEKAKLNEEQLENVKNLIEKVKKEQANHKMLLGSSKKVNAAEFLVVAKGFLLALDKLHSETDKIKKFNHSG